ncbi:hypothetical protein CBG46_01820 [Actinobacillus succinogenes]|uniref:Fimbrial assembly family protein n=1 Tax=Actinobacillus succinogenes (strain ATCC 55618 / DSM 22257 / CCUG 43843 / 130Z) TaxID=339671 RepID=A6VM67_ACTSZ|nr:fimbrial assembly family protein [Actinobacillus succinogenes]ABR74064.1 Fimbrial assembly family protein [Actinobacillus succinogenes 130Z]PHI39502.1 hypothetical protein CBG46_01820 [Actinobacillus succinogenes]
MVNLLPWRLTAHRQRSRQAFKRLMLALSIFFAADIVLWRLNIHAESALNHSQNELEQINRKLPPLIAQVRRQQQHLMKQENNRPVTRERIQQTMDVLQQLPFIQGELSDFTLDAQRITLKGETKNQQEFEQIQQFLNNLPTLDSKLHQFRPQQNELHFEFHLFGENAP